MYLLFILESSDYQCQDWINHPQKVQHFYFLGDTPILPIFFSVGKQTLYSYILIFIGGFISW
jgi:hypothetical protein